MEFSSLERHIRDSHFEPQSDADDEDAALDHVDGRVPNCIEVATVFARSRARHEYLAGAALTRLHDALRDTGHLEAEVVRALPKTVPSRRRERS